jgi:hypothetical protein
MRVNDHRPGDTVVGAKGEGLEIEITWQSHFPLESVKLVYNGQKVDWRAVPRGSQRGEWRIPFDAREDGWLAARVFSQRRDSFLSTDLRPYQPCLVAGRLPPIGSPIVRRLLRAVPG